MSRDLSGLANIINCENFQKVRKSQNSIERIRSRMALFGRQLVTLAVIRLNPGDFFKNISSSYFLLC